jgi:hypothetical protein
VGSSILPDLGPPSAVEGNKIIRIWNPADISSYQDKIINEKKNYPRQIDPLMKNYDPDNDNPILIIYYLKDK